MMVGGSHCKFQQQNAVGFQSIFGAGMVHSLVVARAYGAVSVSAAKQCKVRVRDATGI